MSKPAKRPKAKAPAMTKTELKKRAQTSVRDQPAAKRTRKNCTEGHVKAVHGIKPAKRPQYSVGDTWVNQHNQLLRIVACMPSTQVLDPRFLGHKDRIFVLEMSEGQLQLQYCPESKFFPLQWGWQRLAVPPVPVKLPVSWMQLH